MIPPARKPNLLRRFLRLLGPGVVTGASDDDPSGISTYTVAGASLGYATLWTALITFPLMTAVQYISAKVGLVTGKGLAAVLREHYSKWVLYPAVFGLIVANTINAGVDIGAIAAGFHLILPIDPSYLIVPIGLLILIFQVWGSYRVISNTFKWLCMALLAYIGAAFFAKPDFAEVAIATVVPPFRMDGPYLLTLVAILGTTISPYLLFWQADQEVEELEAQQRQEDLPFLPASDRELRSAALDVSFGMFFSNLVMYFIILASAATLHKAGQTEIADAAEAAEALRPLAGNGATALLALGLIGTGLLAVPILTASGAFAFAQAFGKPYGLNKRPTEARAFYGVMAISTVAGLLINYFGINPVRALFWTAVINGFLSPPLLVLLMLVSNNRDVMGEHVNGRRLNFLGWSTVVLMFAALGGLLATW